MEFKEEIIFLSTNKKIHWLLPIVKKYCDYYNVDPYLIMAIFEFENRKHPKLISDYRNPGNIKSEETQFVMPIEYDSVETSIELYVRTMNQIVQRNEIITTKDIQKLIRPLEPEWGDEVSEVYQKMVDLYRGKYNEEIY
jgi:hypothetical protein